MTYDYSHLYRTAVGFDRLMTLVDAAQKSTSSDGYPPYNIEKLGSDAYRVTVAVAGFRQENLDVEVRDGQLVIRGRNDEAEKGKNFLHRGIALRAFERRFQLADHVEVRGADLREGLLTIDLEREIPEALKPRKISIQGAAKVLDEASSRAA